MLKLLILLKPDCFILILFLKHTLLLTIVYMRRYEMDYDVETKWYLESSQVKKKIQTFY